MKIYRLYSTADRPIAEQIKWKIVNTQIEGQKFEHRSVEVPEQWSQNAANILASKYFRRAGVPDNVASGGFAHGHVAGDMPNWLYPRIPARLANFGGETSARQVFHRLAGCWTYWGWHEGLLDTEEDAQAFYDELYMMLALQVAAPNSPQWFNTGLHWAYGIEGPPARGHWVADSADEVYEVSSIYERPQPSACFIQTVEDNLVDENGMMDLWTREARLFKYGSGSGSNISAIRGKNEKLSGGGVSSGLMSFLPVGDRSAGSIQSGGTTRRAALMRTLNLDHPEIREFIGWKAHEEAKAAMIAVGSRVMHEHLQRIASESGPSSVCPSVHTERARAAGIPEALIDRAREEMVPDVIIASSFEGEAIETVSGQNANNSVRPTDEFMRRVDAGANWELTARTTGEVLATLPARELWNAIVRAAWASGDPGLQFHDTTNAWHTCPNDGEIEASNPCSEYLFLNDTACNLASLRLTAFLRENGSIDLETYQHAVRLWTMVLEISVYVASYPSREIARRSYLYRTLGLGYMDLGGLLMRLALPYDSNEGRALAAGLTSLMTGTAYLTSAEMAQVLEPFPRWSVNEMPMRRVLRNHARAAGAVADGYEGLAIKPMETDRSIYTLVWITAQDAWEEVQRAESFRNAQVTVLAPTGTISFVTDCDTTGVEPDYALIKDKQLAGGGRFSRMVNRAVEPALRRLGYDSNTIEGILVYLNREGTLDGCGDLKNYHYKIFDCVGELRPMAHVLMVAAVQPHVSGGVSKTINLPRAATIADVDHVYREAHRLGVKSVALYRDGSKLTQPLSSVVEIDKLPLPFINPEIIKGFRRGEREYLPWRRTAGFEQKVKVGDQSVFFRVNEYDDGRPGEFFIELAHEGSTLRAMANVAAMMGSLALQYGAPVEAIVDRLLHTKFEPAGVIEGHDRIKVVQSITDYVGRELGITYCGREELGQVVPVRPAAAAQLSHGIVAVLDTRAIGVAKGYSGDVCSVCHNATMRRAGSCLVCVICGTTTGCG